MLSPWALYAFRTGEWSTEGSNKASLVAANILSLLSKAKVLPGVLAIWSCKLVNKTSIPKTPINLPSL